jgi:hypothetical protein
VSVFLALASVVLAGVGNMFLRDLERHDGARKHQVSFELADVAGSAPTDKWVLNIETGVFNHQEVHYTLGKKSGGALCDDGIIKGPTDVATRQKLFDHLAWVTAPSIPATQSQTNLFVLALTPTATPSAIEAAGTHHQTIAGTSVAVDTATPLTAPALPDCTGPTAPSAEQLGHEMVLALAPSSPRETVFMRILQMAVLMHGTTLAETERLEEECFFTGYIDLAGALRKAADDIEEGAMIVTLFGILMLVALVPTVMGSIQESHPSPFYQTGLLVSLGLSVGIYCYLVTEIPISARELVDHVSGSGIHDGCATVLATETTTRHNLDDVDGTFFAAAATAATSFLMAAMLALSTVVPSGKGYTPIEGGSNIAFIFGGRP